MTHPTKELEKQIETLRRAMKEVIELERRALAFGDFFDTHGALLILRKALDATLPTNIPLPPMTPEEKQQNKELLMALKGLMAWCAGDVLDTPEVNAARAAIAKAEGRDA